MVPTFALLSVIMMIMVSCQDNILDSFLGFLGKDCSNATKRHVLTTFKGFYYVQNTSKNFSNPDDCQYFKISSQTLDLPLYISMADTNNHLEDPINSGLMQKGTEVVPVPNVKVAAQNSDGIIVITCFQNSFLGKLYIPLMTLIPKVLICTNEQHVDPSVINNLMNLANMDLGPLISTTQINCPGEDELEL